MISLPSSHKNLYIYRADHMTLVDDAQHIYSPVILLFYLKQIATQTLSTVSSIEKKAL